MNCQHLSLKSGQRPPASSGPSQEDEWETKYSFDALCLSRERQIRVKTSPILTPVSSFVDKCQSLPLCHVFIFSRIRSDVKQLSPYHSLHWAIGHCIKRATEKIKSIKVHLAVVLGGDYKGYESSLMWQTNTELMSTFRKYSLRFSLQAVSNEVFGLFWDPLMTKCKSS